MSHRRSGIGAILVGTLYGFYGWAVFAACALFALVAVLIVPGEARRHRFAAGASRAIFILGGVAPVVRGRENLPPGNAVVVANHASYADGPLLKGYLPARFSFVIKGEMRRIPIAHFLLRRSGSEFVERHEKQGSSRDARRIVKAAVDGGSLAFFPEGTFRPEPGVGRFRAGAFVAAVRGAMPVVPVAISGTRRMMPSGRSWPWPVRLRIDILPPIHPGDPVFADHRTLAETARQRIIAVLGEPDLCTVNGPDFNQD
jgi:1-acyl-sn-glycerol-3-phosphate acyltransferase